MKLVILMRTDLGMGKGKMVAQGAHATSKATRSVGNSSNYNPWLVDGEPKIVLKVSSKEQLMELVKRAGNAKLPTGFIVDAGLTKFQGTATLTCGWIGPAVDAQIDHITKDLKLL